MRWYLRCAYYRITRSLTKLMVIATGLHSVLFTLSMEKLWKFAVTWGKNTQISGRTLNLSHGKHQYPRHLFLLNLLISFLKKWSLWLQTVLGELRGVYISLATIAWCGCGNSMYTVQRTLKAFVYSKCWTDSKLYKIGEIKNKLARRIFLEGSCIKFPRQNY